MLLTTFGGFGLYSSLIRCSTSAMVLGGVIGVALFAMLLSVPKNITGGNEF